VISFVILWPVPIVYDGLPWGFRIRARRFTVPSTMPGASFRVDRSWLADAELVVVRDTPAGSIERALEIRDVKLDALKERN
jgi:hypothetical protein